MRIRRNAVLAGILAACLLFICLTLAARLPSLIALVLAIFGGGTVLAAVTSTRPPARSSGRSQAPVEVPVAPVEPPPVQFQVLPVTGVRLPSARPDYTFAFAAHILWIPATDGVVGPCEIAKREIIRRARELTERQDPSQVSLIGPDLAVTLGVLRSDRDGQVQVKAESVQLQLPVDDQQRLDELARLRKQEELWNYQRREQISKRRYLSTDVFKDTGSAVMWWLAKNEDKPAEAADSIEVFTRLTRAVNDEDGAAPAAVTGPRTPGEHFDAFLDSLRPKPEDDVRLTLASQVARLVDGLDQKAADEMRRRYSAPGTGNSTDAYWNYSEADGAPPE